MASPTTASGRQSSRRTNVPPRSGSTQAPTARKLESVSSGVYSRFQIAMVDGDEGGDEPRVGPPGGPLHPAPGPRSIATRTIASIIPAPMNMKHPGKL